MAGGGPTGLSSQPMKRLFFFLPASLLVVAAACGSSIVDLADYDQTCSFDTECTSVPAGDACECACDVAAVNGRDTAAYMSEWNGKNTTCTNANLCGVCPALPLASCKSGKCSAK